MEPTNHPFRKENDLPNLHEDMFQPLIFQGVHLSQKSTSQIQGNIPFVPWIGHGDFPGASSFHLPRVFVAIKNGHKLRFQVGIDTGLGIPGETPCSN